MKNDIVKTSKFLSYVLRHKPQKIGLQLDDSGWAVVDDLLRLTGITRPELEEVVADNDKQRFRFNAEGTMIRANQGHSVANVDLRLKHKTPPTVLYHGTVDRFLDRIKKEGLQKMNRHHVHLSATEGTALNVGSRRGKAVLLTVDAKAMHRDGYRFQLSDNNVWLTDEVPPKYLTIKS